MKLKESGYDTEVLDQSSVDAAAKARADKRMKRIVATPEEQHLYAFAPNRARNMVDHPGMPCEDYADNGGKHGTAKD